MVRQRIIKRREKSQVQTRDRWFLLVLLLFVTVVSPQWFFRLDKRVAAAAVLDYKPLIMAVQPQDRLVIQGFEGKVKVMAARGGAKDKELEIRLKQENPERLSSEAKAVLDEWHFSLQRKGDVIEAAIRSPQSKSSWSKLLQGGSPQFYLEVISPSMPLEISWRKGQVVVENWDSSVSAYLLHGSLHLQGGKGEATLKNGEGEIKISDRQGGVSADSFNAKLLVNQVKGKMELANFSGESYLQDLEGNVLLTTTSGKVQAKGLKGRLEFHNLRSTVDIKQLDGELRGQNGAGSFSVELVGESDARIQSKEGNVNLSLPHSGASVNLGTSEGQMYLPSYLQVTRQPNLKWTRGRLRGDKKGSIYVRTTEGNIRLK